MWLSVINCSERLVWNSLIKGGLVEKMGFKWTLRILSYVDDYPDKMNLHTEVEWQIGKSYEYKYPEVLSLNICIPANSSFAIILKFWVGVPVYTEHQH